MPIVPVLYTGPAIPTQYDPGWRRFTNLTPAQITSFEQFPQALLLYASQRRWQAEISGTTVGGIALTTQLQDQQKIAGLKQAFDAGVLTSTPFFDAAGNIQTVNAVAFNAIYAAVVQFVDVTYQTAAQLVVGIKGGTITTQAQIDAAYAAIAPNSPSANPASG